MKDFRLCREWIRLVVQRFLGTKKLQKILSWKINTSIQHEQQKKSNLIDTQCAESSKKGQDSKKVALRWDPYLLTRNIRQMRVEIVRVMLTKLQKYRRSNFVSAIIGDETFFYYRNPAISAWIQKGQERPTRIAKIIGSPKVMLTIFFSRQKIWLTNTSDCDQTMDSFIFIDKVLKQLKKSVNKEL
ncbi:MAG: hypothetical protein EZS28_048688, partial [Streblomastix strix]